MSEKIEALRAADQALQQARVEYERAFMEAFPIGLETRHYRGSKRGKPCTVTGYCGHNTLSVRSESGRMLRLDVHWLEEFR